MLFDVFFAKFLGLAFKGICVFSHFLCVFFFWKYDLEDSITASWKQGIVKNEQSREVALRDLQVDDCMW